MRKEKGITLIALIITIIIMLILAGVVITLTIGENGLFKIAKQAGKDYEIASIKEQIITDVYDKQAQNEGDVSDNNLKEILEKYGTLSEEENLMDKTLTTKEKNYKIKVADIFNGTTVEDGLQKFEASTPNVSKIAQKTYVTWELNETGTEYVINDTQTTEPDNWYDYDNGKWANIKTAKNGLEAYWVWIPRYEYIVPTSETATEIEVKFIPINKTVADEGYTIHPAFTNEGNGGFGELDGIWVGKFESNSSNPSASQGGGNTTTLKVQVKPGVTSWRNIETKNMFSVCRKMTKSGEVLAGSTVDSHMMKNTEWGAVAILSQSKYGIYNPESINGKKGNKEYQIWNNSSSSFITGSVGEDKDAKSTPVSAYNSANGPKASTTGTIYGVYDMAGGAWDYVAGVMKGGLDDSNYLDYANSKFGISSQVRDESVSNLEFANRYLDFYNYRTLSSDYSQYIIGDSTVETKGWNSDYKNFVYFPNPAPLPVFLRGRA